MFIGVVLKMKMSVCPKQKHNEGGFLQSGPTHFAAVNISVMFQRGDCSSESELGARHK